MKKSLLLHALSLNDRILEPNKLPINGQVWAYDRSEISREAFVGNCITMLHLMGMEQADISWSEDILAFDSLWDGRLYTVIISLKDDSLASDHYYFLGIWECPEDGQKSKHGNFADSMPWQEEDLLKPDMSYAISLSAEPMQYPDVRKALGENIFSQRIYAEHYVLYGTTSHTDHHTAHFIITPRSHGLNHGRFQVQHALYSIRNLMALTTRAFSIHDTVAEDRAIQGFAELLKKIQGRIFDRIDSPATWDKLSRETGAVTLSALDLLAAYEEHRKSLHDIEALFQVIIRELDSSSDSNMPALFDRLGLPFKHAAECVDRNTLILERDEKRAESLQKLMHSRMVAHQQMTLEKLLTRAAASPQEE